MISATAALILLSSYRTSTAESTEYYPDGKIKKKTTIKSDGAIPWSDNKSLTGIAINI
ncbi:MAG: hypothetical protein GY750_14650 [Lentisphaerae bacterium]|nr:hypothetical protein [Lentisphaerota bacterium]MCP4102641.1 hypothetical protein [Lentisphaerota bacterium]